MDYSKLSDFEINAMVHFGSKPLFKIENSYVSFLNGEGEKTGFGQFYYKSNFPDYCNNPADAWPIIVENGIGIIPYKKGLSESWSTASGLINGTTKAKNPLRAAMIVFLMMQEGKADS